MLQQPRLPKELYEAFKAKDATFALTMYLKMRYNLYSITPLQIGFIPYFTL